jgi:undecaprenyl-diphosphatase
MNFFDALILGIIQGLTEFLPISSSGHLVITQKLMGLSSPGLHLEIWLHMGTLVAVLVYFRRRIYGVVQAILYLPAAPEPEKNRRLFWAVVIGTIPAGIIGVSLEKYFDRAFDSPEFASLMLMVTGIILLLTRLAVNKQKPLTVGRGFLVGCAQAVAILPGISRSGTTISGAMFLGMEPSLAAEFSFLLAIPAIGGAFVLDTLSSGTELISSGTRIEYVVGALASFVVGLLAIHYLLKIIATGRFYLFGLYCLVAGAVSFLVMYR